MYYRVAIQRQGDQLDRPPSWQWKSTALSSLQSLFQVLRLYEAIPQAYLRVFSSLSREDLEEQLRHENSGFGSSSVTAAHFLQQRMIHPSGVTSAGRAQGHDGIASHGVSTRTLVDESESAAHGEGSMSSLESRRFELELGPGGDQDVVYSFVLPPSMPQVLAWMRLLARIQRGELQA